MTSLGDVDYEVLGVDNDSEDDTGKIVERSKKSSSFPIRYVKEEKGGLSFARNLAVLEARGQLIAFTDDVIVGKNWAGNIVRAFRKYDAACIGGKILPIWEQPKPKWLAGLHQRDIFLMN